MFFIFFIFIILFIFIFSQKFVTIPAIFVLKYYRDGIFHQSRLRQWSIIDYFSTAMDFTLSLIMSPVRKCASHTRWEDRSVIRPGIVSSHFFRKISSLGTLKVDIFLQVLQRLQFGTTQVCIFF